MIQSGYKNWTNLLHAAVISSMIGCRINKFEAEKLLDCIYDTWDDKTMNDDTFYRTHGKIGGRKVI
jgi:hypothetical protein